SITTSAQWWPTPRAASGRFLSATTGRWMIWSRKWWRRRKRTNEGTPQATFRSDRATAAAEDTSHPPAQRRPSAFPSACAGALDQPGFPQIDLAVPQEGSGRCGRGWFGGPARQWRWPVAQRIWLPWRRTA